MTIIIITITTIILILITILIIEPRPLTMSCPKTHDTPGAGQAAIEVTTAPAQMGGSVSSGPAFLLGAIGPAVPGTLADRDEIYPLVSSNMAGKSSLNGGLKGKSLLSGPFSIKPYLSTRRYMESRCVG